VNFGSFPLVNCGCRAVPIMGRKAKRKPSVLRPPRPHDGLKKFISTETDLGRNVLEAMETDGYVVLPKVITQEECAELLDHLWNFVEATSPGVSRSNPDSWYPDTQSGGVDPWPHSGWGNLPDMCQSFQGGWVFSKLREMLAHRVFEPLYNTRLLHSSKEGFTFHRPTASSLVTDAVCFCNDVVEHTCPVSLLRAC